MPNGLSASGGLRFLGRGSSLRYFLFTMSSTTREEAIEVASWSIVRAAAVNGLVGVVVVWGSVGAEDDGRSGAVMI